MVGEEGPGEDGPAALRCQGGQAGDEVLAIRVVPDDGPALKAAHHDMVQGVRGIEAGLTGHGEREPSTAWRTWQRLIIRII